MDALTRAGSNVKSSLHRFNADYVSKLRKAEKGWERSWLGNFDCRIDGWQLDGCVLSEFSHVGPMNWQMRKCCDALASSFSMYMLVYIWVELTILSSVYLGDLPLYPQFCLSRPHTRKILHSFYSGCRSHLQVSSDNPIKRMAATIIDKCSSPIWTSVICIHIKLQDWRRTSLILHVAEIMIRAK